MYHCLRIQYRTQKGDYVSAVQRIEPSSDEEYARFIRTWALHHLPEGSMLTLAETYWMETKLFNA